jgi:aminopeptidase-like protein
MPVFVDFRIQCDKCKQSLDLVIQVTNVNSGFPKFDTKLPDDWEVKDVGSYKTKVLCPTCR